MTRTATTMLPRNLAPARHEVRAELPDRINGRIDALLHSGRGMIRKVVGGGWNLEKMVRTIEQHGAQYEDLSDKRMAEKLQELRLQLHRRGLDQSLVSHCFALIREKSRRILGMYHYPCQLKGGWFCCRGWLLKWPPVKGKRSLQLWLLLLQHWLGIQYM